MSSLLRWFRRRDPDAVFTSSSRRGALSKAFEFADGLGCADCRVRVLRMRDGYHRAAVWTR